MAGPGGAEGVPDMTVISDIDEHGINKNLQKRYKHNKIYTYTGPILVAVNPYKELPYYGQDSVTKYNGAKLGSEEPHVFAIVQLYGNDDASVRHHTLDLLNRLGLEILEPHVQSCSS